MNDRSIETYGEVRSRPLIKHLRLDEQLKPFADIWAKHALKLKYEVDEFRKDLVRNTEEAMSVLLANILDCYRIDKELYLKVRLRNEDYKISEFNPIRISAKSIRTCLSVLIYKGFISIKGGNYNHEKNMGFPTIAIYDISLIKEVDAYLEGLTLSRSNSNTARCTGKTFHNNDNIILLSDHFVESNVPLIELRSKKDKTGRYHHVKYDLSAEIKDTTDFLEKYNKFLMDNWIDILVSDEEFKAIQQKRSVDEFGVETPSSWRTIDLVGGRKLRRVFSNGSFSEGGRFYGGWWQNVPSDQRQFITINWLPTVELDFSNMQIAMLYAKKGQTLDGDAYALEGVDPKHRKLLKRIVFKIINATGRIRPALTQELPEGWTNRALLDALKEKHSSIAEYFATGEGIKLQRIDSNIAERVLKRMIQKDIVCLPIHDSFIVTNGKQDILRKAMLEEYRSAMEQDIGISEDDNLDSLLPLNSKELHDEEVKDIWEQLSELEQRNGFDGYRQRKRDVLEYFGEGWGHSHTFLI